MEPLGMFVCRYHLLLDFELALSLVFPLKDVVDRWCLSSAAAAENYSALKVSSKHELNFKLLHQKRHLVDHRQLAAITFEV